MTDALGQRIVQRQAELDRTRQTHVAGWESVRHWLQPEAIPFTAAAQNQHESPPSDRPHILENTGGDASDNLAAALYGSLTNSGTMWSKVRMRRAALNDTPGVKRALSEINTRIFQSFEAPRAGYHKQIPSVFKSCVDFGWGAMFQAGRANDLPVFTAVPVQQLAIARDIDRRVDTVFRRFTRTARQVVQEFGDAVPEKIRKRAAKKPDQSIELIHAVFPREDGFGRAGARGMPIASVHVLIETKTTLRESGYEEMPYHIFEWALDPGREYPRGVGHKARYDVQLLQRVHEGQARGVELLNEPPLMVANDGVTSKVSLRRGALNYVDSETMAAGRDPIKALNHGSRPDVAEDYMAGVRQRIERYYLNHLIQLTRDARMTATHALLLDEETQRLLGPTLGGFISTLAGMVERQFLLLLRNGLVPPPPAIMEGEPFEVEFVSPMIQRQRLAEVRGLSQSFDIVAPMADRSPDLLDNYDFDEVTRFVNERLNVPANLLRAPRDVQTLRTQRQEEADAAQQRDDMVATAQAAAQGGQALQSAANAQALQRPGGQGRQR